jgi:hypothetical protein
MPSNHGKEQGPFGQPSGLSKAGNIAAWSGRAEVHGAQAERGKADYGRKLNDDGHNVPQPGAGGLPKEKKAKD